MLLVESEVLLPGQMGIVFSCNCFLTITLTSSVVGQYTQLCWDGLFVMPPWLRCLAINSFSTQVLRDNCRALLPRKHSCTGSATFSCICGNSVMVSYSVTEDALCTDSRALIVGICISKVFVPLLISRSWLRTTAVHPNGLVPIEEQLPRQDDLNCPSPPCKYQYASD